MLKLFCGKVLVFTLPVIIFYVLLYNLGYKPLITNSTSFDAKILQINRLKLKNADIMVIGSSVALNDINSQILVNKFHRSYYNFGAWGLQIDDILFLYNNYYSKFHPKYVILPSTAGDFTTQPNSSLGGGLNLNRTYFPLYYIKNFSNLREIVQRKKEFDLINTNTGFESLLFDKYGGVGLHIPKSYDQTKRLKDIDDTRKEFPDKYTNEDYKSLDSLAHELQNQQVKLIFVQVPFSTKYIQTDAQRNELNAHYNKCKSIIESRGGAYFNYGNDKTLPDSLFADPVHLAANGSLFFTKQVIGPLSKVIN